MSSSGAVKHTVTVLATKPAKGKRGSVVITKRSCVAQWAPDSCAPAKTGARAGNLRSNRLFVRSYSIKYLTRIDTCIQVSTKCQRRGSCTSVTEEVLRGCISVIQRVGGHGQYESGGETAPQRAHTFHSHYLDKRILRNEFFNRFNKNISS
jgi:hypothetical protein